AAGGNQVAVAGNETAHDRGADHAAVTRNVNSPPGKIKDLRGHHIDLSEVALSSISIPAGAPVSDRDHVRLPHLYDQSVKACLMFPAEDPSALARVTNKRIDFGRAEITRVDLDEHPAGRLLEAFLLEAAAAPDDRPADVGKSLLDEFAHRMGFTGCKHVVIGLVLLQDQPHPLDEVTRMPPVARGIEISKE